MKTRNLILGMLVLAIVLVAATSSTDNSEPLTDNSTADKDNLVTGQELFRLNCAGCHGIDRKGNLPTYPSLVDIKEKLAKEEIITQIKNGKGLMPPMAHLADNEINAIAGYLVGENGNEKKIEIAALTPVKQGEMLFKSNCSSCHRSTTNDPAPQNANTQMCAMMEPAVLAGVTKRFTNEDFINILNTGPCYMPSFNFLNAKDKDALWAFFKTLEDKGEPEGKTMGQMCPMMKGMGDMNGMDMDNSSNANDTTNIKADSVYYTCSMHPEVKQAMPGNCPKCGMALTKVENNKSRQKQKMGMMCPMMKKGKSCCGM